MSTWFNRRRKAIAAVVVPVAVFALAKWGLDTGDEWTVALTSIITGVTVHEVPNRP